MESPVESRSDSSSSSSSLMDKVLGLLRVRVKRGVNLAVRDLFSSDPYVVIEMGNQKLKTRVIRKNLNPEWNEDLTFSVSDPNLPIKFMVYEKDTFTPDDKLGDAEIDIKPFFEAVKMQLEGVPSGTVITRIQPSTENCLAGESCIAWKDGKVVQDFNFRLRNVECGEVELQVQWVDLPGSRRM